MKEKLKEYWHILKSGKPGERFLRFHSFKKEKHPVKMGIKIALGILCLPVAAVLSVTPGPAFIFWILGFALISSQLLLVARFLDRMELFIRKIFNR